MTELLHANALMVRGVGVLLLGPSGSGKSDFSLRLIDRGAQLIADDYVVIEQRQGGLWASAAPKIAGKMEIRHIGIVDVDHSAKGPLQAAVKLSTLPLDRLPEEQFFTHLETKLPLITLNPFEVSATIKLEWFVKRLKGQLAGGDGKTL